MRGFDFVKIVKMGASLCEQCVTRLHLTSLSFGDRLTSIAYALLFALSKIRSRRLPLTKPATGCFCSAEPYHEFFSNNFSACM